MKFRGVPVNVNYRYLDEELLYLIENSDAEAHELVIESVAGYGGGGAVVYDFDADGYARKDGTRYAAKRTP